MKKPVEKRGGFTLVELLIVMAVLGVIAAILLPRFPVIIETRGKRPP
ncbi:MAG: type II secretion system protein [Clostridiales bacterium]|nr:type II secretion system protein [Clostridiales bacterium]